MEARSRARLRLRAACAIAVLALLVGCRSTPPPPAPKERAVVLERLREPPAAAEFDALRAWTHLRVIERIGSRASGSTGAARTRSYVTSQLSAFGIEIRERQSQVEPAAGGDPVTLTHVTAVLPGESEDVFVIAAHYDTPAFDSFAYLGTNESASGTALLLELARTLSVRDDRPYTIWLVWIDGDAYGQDESAVAPSLVGSRALADSLAREGELDRIRFAVFYGGVADADLEIRRDLRSHLFFREAFWSAARDLGHAATFSDEAIFRAPETAQASFAAQSLRAGVSIADDHYGAGEGRGTFWYSSDDRSEHCSPQSLEIVGRVSVEAISRIGKRLARIDEFARDPVTAGTASAKIAP